MSDDELKTLKKEVSTKKRIAMDWASKIHDLVEDRLLDDFSELPDLTQKTVDACQEYQQAKAMFEQAQK